MEKSNPTLRKRIFGTGWRTQSAYKMATKNRETQENAVCILRIQTQGGNERGTKQQRILSVFRVIGKAGQMWGKCGAKSAKQPAACVTQKGDKRETKNRRTPSVSCNSDTKQAKTGQKLAQNQSKIRQILAVHRDSLPRQCQNSTRKHRKPLVAGEVRAKVKQKGSKNQRKTACF